MEKSQQVEAARFFAKVPIALTVTTVAMIGLTHLVERTSQAITDIFKRDNTNHPKKMGRMDKPLTSWATINEETTRPHTNGWPESILDIYSGLVCIFPGKESPQGPGQKLSEKESDKQSNQGGGFSSGARNKPIPPEPYTNGSIQIPPGNPYTKESPKRVRFRRKEGIDTLVDDTRPTEPPWQDKHYIKYDPSYAKPPYQHRDFRIPQKRRIF